MKTLLILIAALTLTACGGGGGEPVAKAKFVACHPDGIDCWKIYNSEYKHTYMQIRNDLFIYTDSESIEEVLTFIDPEERVYGLEVIR